jgi:hypothetical protein
VTQILDGPLPRAQPGESHWGCRHCTINLRTTNENAKEIGRNELCRALIERLELGGDRSIGIGGHDLASTANVDATKLIEAGAERSRCAA